MLWDDMDYGILLGKIAFISVVYFVTQLVVDVLCAYLAERTGCRKCAVSLELCSAVGLIGLAFLPELLPAPLC